MMNNRKLDKYKEIGILFERYLLDRYFIEFSVIHHQSNLSWILYIGTPDAWLKDPVRQHRLKKPTGPLEINGSHQPV